MLAWEQACAKSVWSSLGEGRSDKTPRYVAGISACLRQINTLSSKKGAPAWDNIETPQDAVRDERGGQRAPRCIPATDLGLR